MFILVFMHRNVLVVNPGSTSTKVAIYEGARSLFSANMPILAEELTGCDTILAQLDLREAKVRSALARWAYDLSRLSLVVGRGGLLRPLVGGIYRIGPAMLEDLNAARYGEHASNLGAFLADRIAAPLGIPAYIADPVVVDELGDIARVMGHKLFVRRSIFHALNHKAVARRWCAENRRPYDKARLIVAHMGGGVSVGLHLEGRVVDVNQALDGEGPFSAERAGTLPAGDLARLCFSGKYSLGEVLSMIKGKGGLVSLAGSSDLRILEKRMNSGDAEAELLFKAFAYGVAKAIGGLAAAASGKVDAIILTGGIAFSQTMMALIGKMCNFIAPIVIYPGEDELEALALAGMRVLSGQEKALDY
jgi:butyrate kinase